MKTCIVCNCTSLKKKYNLWFFDNFRFKQYQEQTSKLEFQTFLKKYVVFKYDFKKCASTQNCLAVTMFMFTCSFYAGLGDTILFFSMRMSGITCYYDTMINYVASFLISVPTGLALPNFEYG